METTKKILFIGTILALFTLGLFLSQRAFAYTDFIIPDYAVTTIYQFDNNLTDDKGSQNATVHSGGTAAYTTGKFDNAFDFNGSTYLDGHAAGANATSTFSIGMWVKYTTTDKFFYASDDGYNSTRLLDDAGKIMFQQCNGSIGCVAVETTSTYNNGNWHLIVATQQGAQARKLYVDGAYIDGDAYGIHYANTGSAQFGANSDGTAKFTGQIDNVFEVNYQMSLAEIETIWNSGTGERVSMGITPNTTANDYINFNIPTQADTVRNDNPNLFNINWHTGATTSNASWSSLIIEYGTSTGGFASTTFTASTSRTWSLNEWNSSNGNTFTSFAMPKTIPLIPDQRYYAKATLNWESLLPPDYTTVISTTTATSSVLFFVTTTTPPTPAACNGVWDCILYGFAQTLFTPHDISMASYRATYDQLQTSPPFSYFFSYVTAAENAATSTISTSTNYDVKLDMPAPWGTITVLTSSSLSNFVGTSTAMTVEKIFNIQRMVIWVGAGLRIISLFVI